MASRFDGQEAEEFEPLARRALELLSERPGFLRGRLARSTDDPQAWVLTTEWDSVGSYRRSLSSYQVKLEATTLLSRGRDEPTAFEVTAAFDEPVPPAPGPSHRARP